MSGTEMNAAEIWHKNGFFFEEALNNVSGLWVELGGPTPEYSLVDFNLKRRLWITNLADGDKADLILDAKNMPFRSNSVGAIFASCLPVEVKSQMAVEVVRVLVPSGLYIIQGVDQIDLDSSKRLGLEVVYRHKTEFLEPIIEVDFIDEDPSAEMIMNNISVVGYKPSEELSIVMQKSI